MNNGEARELVLMAKSERMLAEATTIDEIKDIRDKAELARAYAKKIGLSQEIIVHAGAIKVKAEQKLGKLLGSINLAKGSLGNQYTGKRLDRSHDATGPIRLQDLGITKSESSRVQTIASLPAPVFNKFVQQAIDSGQEPTTAGLLRLAKRQKVSETIVCNADVPGFVSSLEELTAEGRKFSTLYIDPPWPYDNQATRAATNGHYPTLPLEKIAAEPVKQLAADKCHLHLWTTNGFLPAALSLIAQWGFEFKSMLVWVKPQMGIGNYWRCSHEMLLLGTKGNMPFCDHSLRSWFEADRTEHSAKPEIVRGFIEKASPGQYLEMYGRRLPPNDQWTVYGNQLPSLPSESSD
jgi:N6-adenosine-specific RNA methylase IME4